MWRARHNHLYIQDFRQPSKLAMGVRFPSPAPVGKSMGYGLLFFRIQPKAAIFATKADPL
jgi:hypothetical protein